VNINDDALKHNAMTRTPKEKPKSPEAKTGAQNTEDAQDTTERLDLGPNERVSRSNIERSNATHDTKPQSEANGADGVGKPPGEESLRCTLTVCA